MRTITTYRDIYIVDRDKTDDFETKRVDSSSLLGLHEFQMQMLLLHFDAKICV
jgi:hypothetical protein